MTGKKDFLISVVALLLQLWLAGCSQESPDKTETDIADFGLELLSHADVVEGLGTDVYGYLDKVTGKEYAVIGDYHRNGQKGSVFIFEIASDGEATLTAEIPDLNGFDMKVWDHYLYIANGGPDVVSVTEKSFIYDIGDPSNPVFVGQFPAGHNAAIDELGYLYVSATLQGGVIILDLNRDPTAPDIIWQDNSSVENHDVTVINDRLYDFHADQTVIYDIADRSDPVKLGTVDDPAIDYHHSGWATEDGQYLYICDEGEMAYQTHADITIWDISDPVNPHKVGEIGDPKNRVHNIYIKDGLAYVSHYGAGVRVYDMTDPTVPELVGQFSTNINDGEGHGNGFVGAFGVFPFTKSGFIYASDIENGLFVLKLMN